uniref:Uncharacterized protein n=1 Tax=Meloidogyne incognita TaxID=6306 RepID=A0A914LQI4_MELIC
MEIRNVNLPAELICEITTFIRLHRKWGKCRVSKIFDIFVIKIQKKFIILLNILRKQIGDIWTKIREQFTFLKDIEDGIGKDYVNKLSSSYECVYRQTRDFLKDFVIFKDLKEKLPSLPQRNLHRLIEIKEWRDFTKKQFKVVSVFLKETFYDDFEAFYDDFAILPGFEKSVEILTALRTFLKGISSLLDDYVDYYKECFPRNTRTVTWDVEA